MDTDNSSTSLTLVRLLSSVNEIRNERVTTPSPLSSSTPVATRQELIKAPKKKVKVHSSKRRRTHEEDSLTLEPNTRLETVHSKRLLKRPKQEKKKAKDNNEANQNALITKEAVQMYRSLFPSFFQDPFQIVCLEIETFEFDPKKITEIAIMIGHRECASQFKFRGYHYLIQEHIYLENGKHSGPSSKFKFIGKSDIVPLEVALKEIRMFLTVASLLISHCLETQFQILKLNHQEDILQFCMDPTLLKADTQTIFKAVTRTHECVPLQTILNHLHIHHNPSLLHNAGNDAIHIVNAFLRMMPSLRIPPSGS